MSRISLPDGIALDDPRPIAASAPYTYFLPHPDELAALKPGDGVKAVFRQLEGAHTYDAERMWVGVERIEDGWVHGSLDNEPVGMDKLTLGDPVVLPLTHVISTHFPNDENPRPSTPAVREYWDRCMVDICVLEGRSHVDYLYRQVPDMGQEGDKYPDSGWRFRGTDEAVEADSNKENPFEYIAIGKVLNADDRWLHLVDEEPGVAFQWDPDAQDYIRYDRPALLVSDLDDDQ